jgi:hypothetical protein
VTETVDLTPFLARGFGPEHDHKFANTKVRGIDRLLTCSKIRLAAEIWKDPDVRGLFAVEWERSALACSKDYGAPPPDEDAAARFGGAGIVNDLIFP